MLGSALHFIFLKLAKVVEACSLDASWHGGVRRVVPFKVRREALLLLGNLFALDTLLFLTGEGTNFGGRRRPIRLSLLRAVLEFLLNLSARAFDAWS